MNLKRLAEEINPDLDLRGCYPNIIPKITTPQLLRFYDAAIADDWGDVFVVWAVEACKVGLGKFAEVSEVVEIIADVAVASVDSEADSYRILVSDTPLTEAQVSVLVGKIYTCEFAERALLHATLLLPSHVRELVDRINYGYSAANVITQVPERVRDSVQPLLDKVIKGGRAAALLKWAKSDEVIALIKPHVRRLLESVSKDEIADVLALASKELVEDILMIKGDTREQG